MDEEIDIRYLEETDDDIPESIIIPHRPSPNFISDFATGAILSGSPVENLF